ncbi:MAG: zf-TFIIB domain-containing protein [Mariprofundales bacterium]
MKCSSCGAPLPEGKIHCTYCGTANAIDLQGIHEFTVTKPESERNCPVCRLALQTIDLDTTNHFYIERCSHCFGLFFDPNELPALLARTVQGIGSINYKRLQEIADHRADSGIKRAAYVHCPVCDRMMTRRNFGRRSGVVVDRCVDHGVWLDGGELQQLMQWRKAGGALLDARTPQVPTKTKPHYHPAIASSVTHVEAHSGGDTLFSALEDLVHLVLH